MKKIFKFILVFSILYSCKPAKTCPTYARVIKVVE